MPGQRLDKSFKNPDNPLRILLEALQHPDKKGVVLGVDPFAHDLSVFGEPQVRFPAIRAPRLSLHQAHIDQTVNGAAERAFVQAHLRGQISETRAFELIYVHEGMALSDTHSKATHFIPEPGLDEALQPA